VVTKAGHQFTEVNPALNPGMSHVKEAFVLCFLEYKMKHDPLLFHVIEYHFPLVQLAAIEPVTLIMSV
jgi:hypothetical protein